MLEFVVFLNCICIGILTFVLSEVSFIFKKLSKNNLIINIALDFSVYLFGGIFVMALCFKMYDGAFKPFEIMGFVLGIILAKNTFKNLFANFLNMLYNGIIKIAHRFSKTKIGERMCK